MGFSKDLCDVGQGQLIRVSQLFFLSVSMLAMKWLTSENQAVLITIMFSSPQPLWTKRHAPPVTSTSQALAARGRCPGCGEESSVSGLHLFSWAAVLSCSSMLTLLLRCFGIIRCRPQGVWVCACMHACVYVHIIPYVNCFGRTVIYVCIEYCIWVNMYHVSA